MLPSLVFPYTDDQRILHFNWTRGTPSHNQPKTVSDTASYSWLFSCKKSQTSLDSFQRYCWSKNLVIWLDLKHNWPNPVKSGSFTSCRTSLIISTQKIYDIDLFLSGDIVAHLLTPTKVIISDTSFLDYYLQVKKNEDTNWLFPETSMIKESCNLVRQQTTGHTKPKVVV